VARLTRENVELAREIIQRYPRPRSALIPLLHLAQSQDGWVTDDAMEHVAELLDLTPAEVFGTCSFYEMFKREPVGKYLLNVCTNLPCMLNGAYELLHHVEEKLGVSPGRTTSDGMFTLEEVECLAACTEAPCLQVNYRYFTNLTPEAASTVVDDLRGGRLDDVVPPHGTTTRVRQAPSPNWAGNNAEGLPEVFG
jgi:NADH-quinone oxidoreductase subunit E